MKLSPDQFLSNSIRRYQPGKVQINQDWHEGSLLILPNGHIGPWSCTNFTEVVAKDFEPILASSAEIVLFGTGETHHFFSPVWLAPFLERRIGVECMNSRSACRTYNFLVGEGRSVAMALLP